MPRFSKGSPAQFVKRLRLAEEWQVVTRWRFERLLDRVAEQVTSHLSTDLVGEVGCSLLYHAQKDCYVLGGSSSDRRRMDREARYYNMDTKAARRSLTGTVISLGAELLLDDISLANTMTKLQVEHRNKNCELEARQQKAYLAIPIPSQKNQPPLTEKSDPCHPPRKMPDGILRCTFTEVGEASLARNLIPKNLLSEISILLRSGRSAVEKNRGKGELALADLGNDLLSYRDREYQGLDQLAFHLQTHYDDCECSIFLAKRRPSPRAGPIYIDLYLAATTALTRSKQHQKFHKAFEEEGRAFYTCVFERHNRPAGSEVAKAAKTAQAYYDPARPVLVNENLRSRHYPGKGEIDRPKEFMGFAIPSPDANEYPYGVIRLVRYTDEKFSRKDLRLAQATTRYLRSWLVMFPLNHELKIEYISGNLREEILIALFDIPTGGIDYKRRIEHAEREFSWLLQKIFHRSSKVTVKEMFSGRSGSLVLLVKNDYGLDLILKCEKKRTPWAHTDNDIQREVNNYRKFIEGKLELNHNIIYQELVRETQWLVGFATSFLHSKSRNRISISQACSEWESRMGSIPRLGRALTQVIERLIGEVWAWWYSPDELEDCLQDDAASYLSYVLEDPLFSFLNNIEKLDQRFLGAVRQIPGFKNAFQPGSDRPPPSELWELLKVALSQPKRCLTWRRAVTHGDTHGDNIFFDPETMDIWVIDFARTGYRTDIFDLALFETDLKFKQFPNLCGNRRRELRQRTLLERMREFERDLAQQTTYEVPVLPRTGGDSRLAVIGKLVADLRQLACQGLGRRGDFADYKIVLFLLAFKYMKVQGLDPEHRLLAYNSARELLTTLQAENSSVK